MSTPFHSRAAWGARPARYVTRRTLTMDTAHYGGPSPWGSVDRSSAVRFHATADHNRCATIVRAYQAFHMDSRGWADIAYSSLVCPHGHRYEGRGLDARTAAQGTNIGNNTSHATCYIAGDGDPLTVQAMAAYVDESRRLRGLKKGHRDWKSTACPGDPLYRWVHSGQSAPSPAPAPEPKPEPPPPLEDEMPYPVIACSTSDPQYKGREKWYALTPRGPYHVPDMEAYGVDVGNGTYKPMVRVNARQYDVALRECRERAINVPAGLEATLNWYAAAGKSPLHTIIQSVVDA